MRRSRLSKEDIFMFIFESNNFHAETISDEQFGRVGTTVRNLSQTGILWAYNVKNLP